ncbi:hypothetical protein [Corynebacterium sp. 13CS0277]|uniref:hypothetical protein n=1 Tax=Corynebacterium sp. 13CS0277 TaxID=2071994 RepID=UPI0013049566|nr:hypothetical protein [Corynebacterium sp. 13CS0277]
MYKTPFPVSPKYDAALEKLTTVVELLYDAAEVMAGLADSTRHTLAVGSDFNDWAEELTLWAKDVQEGLGEYASFRGSLIGLTLDDVKKHIGHRVTLDNARTPKGRGGTLKAYAGGICTVTTDDGDTRTVLPHHVFYDHDPYTPPAR